MAQVLAAASCVHSVVLSNCREEGQVRAVSQPFSSQTRVKGCVAIMFICN